MSFLGGIIGGVVGGMLANNHHSNRSRQTPVLREGADLLYYNTPVDPTQRIFGVPGASLRFANLDNQDALNAGIAGEQRVAAELHRLASLYPNTYVFHSVKLPGQVGDMDHIVVQGNRALLVDSKNWKGNSHYSVIGMTDEEDVITRDGYEFEGGRVHLTRQMVDWSMLFLSSDVNVTAVLVVANTTSTVDVRSNIPYSFVNLNGLADVFASTFSTDYVPPLNDAMLRFYTDMVQNPDFDPNNPANYVQEPVYTPATRVKQPATTMTKWLVFWSVMNYVLLPFMFPLAGLSAIPLIVLTHSHKAKVKAQGLGGSGLLSATLVFSYMLLTVWALATGLVAWNFIAAYT